MALAVHSVVPPSFPLGEQPGFSVAKCATQLRFFFAAGAITEIQIQNLVNGFFDKLDLFYFNIIIHVVQISKPLIFPQ